MTRLGDRGLLVLAGLGPEVPDGRGGAVYTQRATLQWDGSAWKELHPAHSPPAHGSLFWDGAGSRVIDYEPYGDNTLGNSDIRPTTWAWTGDDWTQLHTTHTPRGACGAAIIDGDAKVPAVLFRLGCEIRGDPSGAAQPTSWRWRGGDWLAEPPGTIRVPVGNALVGGGAGLDTGAEVQLVAGPYAQPVPTKVALSRWQDGAWTEVPTQHSPPPLEYPVAAAYDSARRAFVLVGRHPAAPGGGPQQLRALETWIWSGVDWTQAP